MTTTDFNDLVNMLINGEVDAILINEGYRGILEEIKYTKKVDMTYEFTGDEKDKAGFAQGVITITPTESNACFFIFR